MSRYTTTFWVDRWIKERESENSPHTFWYLMTDQEREELGDFMDECIEKLKGYGKIASRAKAIRESVLLILSIAAAFGVFIHVAVYSIEHRTKVTTPVVQKK